MEFRKIARQQKRFRYKEDFWTLWEKARVG